MAGKKLKTLTKAELRVMEVLWQRRSGTVADVVAALQSPPLAYTTVLTMLRILERKGYIRHKIEGRAFRYYPVVNRQQASTSALRHLLHRFFDGAPGKLAINILEHERLSERDLQQLKRLIQEARQK